MRDIGARAERFAGAVVAAAEAEHQLGRRRVVGSRRLQRHHAGRVPGGGRTLDRAGERRGVEAPVALVPDLWFDGISQTLKGLGRISVEGYVAGSAAFFEDYLRRLSTYAGREVPAASRRGD